MDEDGAPSVKGLPIRRDVRGADDVDEGTTASTAIPRAPAAGAPRDAQEERHRGGDRLRKHRHVRHRPADRRAVAGAVPVLLGFPDGIRLGGHTGAMPLASESAERRHRGLVGSLTVTGLPAASVTATPAAMAMSAPYPLAGALALRCARSVSGSEVRARGAAPLRQRP